MKSFAFGALLLAAACGGGGSVNITADAGSDGGSGGACNVNTQAGCEAGEKCSWVRVQASQMAQLGKIACVPDGDAALDAACTWGAAGDTTGFDNCEKGLYCLAPSNQDQAAGICLDTCSLVDAVSNTCATNFVCSRYANTYANSGGDPPAGLCTPACDPLTQKLVTGEPAGQYCGEPVNLGADNAVGGDGENADFQEAICVGVPGNAGAPAEFSCAGMINPTWKHRTNTEPTTFLNDCGTADVGVGPNVPWLDETSASDDTTCISLCKPVEVYQGLANAATLSKGMAPNDFATFGIVGENDEDCKFLWWLESDDAPLTDLSNGLGFAFNTSGFYTWDDDMMPATDPVAVPRCDSLPNTDDPGDMDMLEEHLEWGCGPFPEALTGAAREEALRVARKNAASIGLRLRSDLERSADLR